MFPTRFILAEILVLAGGAVLFVLGPPQQSSRGCVVMRRAVAPSDKAVQGALKEVQVRGVWVRGVWVRGTSHTKH